MGGASRSFFLDRAAEQHHHNSHNHHHMTSTSSQTGVRSRSHNTAPSGVYSPELVRMTSNSCNNSVTSESLMLDADEQYTFNINNYCNNEIELRDRVLSSKRVLLRNFFTYYIKQLMIVNEKLNLSYVTKLKEQYMKLKDKDKITISELQETIDEMEVDE